MNHYSEILNKHLVKILIDNLKERYPGVADNLILEKISYLKMVNILKNEYEKNGNIRNLIRIIEEAELRLSESF